MKDKLDDIIKSICVVCIVGAIIAYMLIYYSGKNETFVYEEHLSENVLTVSDESDATHKISVNLQEMTYYVMNIEGNIHEMALQYNSDNPEAYWSVKIEKGTYTMKDYAKDWAFDSCVRDNIYYIEALKSGIKLAEEEKDMAENDAKTILSNLSGKALGVSNFDLQSLYNIEEKLYLTSKYLDILVEQGHTMEELELKGTYYEELRQNYSIATNDKLWDKVRFGNITITK